MTNTMTQHREIQACYGSRGFENVRHRIWHRGVQTGTGIQACTGMVRDEDQAWHWRPHAINSSAMVSYKNCTPAARQNLL